MKRTVLLLLAATALLATSCRKEYQCTCMDLSGDTETRTIKKRTKVEAERACENNLNYLLSYCVLED